jgi:tetratricopeptide (TPR) repeat protein
MNDPVPQQVRSPRRAIRVIVLGLALVALLCAASYLIGRHAWAYYHFHQAEPAMARRDFDQARAHLTLCLEVWPDSGETHFLIARAARRGGEYGEAATHLSRARELKWVAEALDAEHAMLKAQRAEQDELFVVQGLLLSWIDAGHPDSVLMLEALVQGYMKTYFLSAAVNCLDMWLDRDPDDPQAYFWRGEVLEIFHKYAEALADYQRAVDLAPDRDDARLKLADGLLHAQGARAAAPHYETLYERQPGEPEVLLGLARCRLELGETDEARRLLDALLAAQPRDGRALGERGKIELEAGHSAEAERRLRQAVAVVPYEHDVVYCFVQALRQQNMKEEAEEWTARLDRIDADLSRMNVVMRAISTDPRDPALRHEAGAIFLRNGQAQEGLRWLTFALQQDPNYRPTHELLAEYLEKHGQPEEAAAHRRLAGQGH